MKLVRKGSCVLPMVYVCLGLGFIPGTSAYAATPDANTAATVQQDIVRDMAKGVDVSQRVQDYTRTYSSSATLPATPRSGTAAQMQRSLEALRDLLGNLRRQGGISLQNVEQFSNRYAAVQAANLLLQDRLSQIQSQISQLAVSSTIEQRRLQEEKRYKKLVDVVISELAYIDESLRTTKDLDQLFSQSGFTSKANDRISSVFKFLQQNLSTIKPKILRAGTLPYRQLETARRNPQVTPLIKAAYEEKITTSEAADLIASPAAPLSAEILAKAKSLGNDYIKIYDYVRSQVRNEWYAGSMKGATGTMRQLSGNDVDQAALLIALFRASGLPARYVQGVIELPIETVMESLAITDSNQAVKALSRAGVAYTPQIRGGRIAAVHIEHVWVEALVPYNNYRGSLIDRSGESWLPLMPSIKTYANTAATNILQTMAVDSEAEIQHYLSQSPEQNQQSDFLSALRSKVNNYLNANGRQNSYAQQLGAIKVQVDDLGLIPHTLPVKVIAVTGEYASLPGTMRHRLRFVIRNADKDTAAIVLDHSVSLAEIASERLTLSYIPATVDDQRTVNKYGGLDNVPAYLVRLRPQIKINGRQAAVAADAINMGISHRFEIYLDGPYGSQHIGQDVISGGYHAISVDAQQHAALIVEDDPADTEYLGAKILAQLGNTYSRQWQEAEEELAGLHDVAVIRPLPSVAIVSNVYKVDMVLGRPHQIEFQGVSLDAALRIAEPVSRSADPVINSSAEKGWMQMSALQGSTLEASIFEELFAVESISADKGLQLAAQQGITVHSITGANSNSILPGLNHPSPVIADISKWLSAGMHVQVPARQITFNDWTGSVWRVEDPDTGAAGYFISGGLAGGTTTTYPSGWVIAWFNWALAAVNSPPPNQDPLSVASIGKISATDGQQGKAGEPLADMLSVMVHDKAGLPVAGAAVTFTVTSGEGNFAGATALTVVSDFSGIASVEYTLGQKTDVNPYYAYEKPDDEYVSRASLNVIDVSVASYNGTLFTDSPFFALAYAGEASQLIRTNTYPGPTGHLPGHWVDAIVMKPVDQYGNPVSNVSVDFSISGGGSNGCIPAVSATPGAVFNNHFQTNGCPANPLIGECGSPSYTTTSDPSGASAGVIVGSTSGITYTVSVNAAAASQQYTYTTAGSCRNTPTIVHTSTSLIGDNGQNLNAARAGEKFKEPVRATLFFGLPSVEKIENGQVYWMSDYNMTRVNASVDFSVSNAGVATGASNVGAGTYETNVYTSSFPGINAVTMTYSNVVMQQYIDIMKDAVKSATTDKQVKAAEANLLDAENFLATSRSWTASEVYGVNPTVNGVESQNVPLGIDPGFILLTENNQSEFPVKVNYNINPGSYEANHSLVNIYENASRIYAFNGSANKANGFVDLPRSTRFDPDLDYEAEVILNQGSPVEVKSDKFPLRIAQRLFKNVDRHISVSMDVDIANQRTCEFGSEFNFTLTEEARVTLKMFKQNGSIFSDIAQTIINDEVLAAGDHNYDFSPRNITPGNYRYELSGISSATAIKELKQGSASSRFSTRDQLPVGHTLVKGVNTFNGSLSLSANDMGLPGRGVPLELTRSYSSRGSDPGPLGFGWTHNYDSKIVITRCGEIIVSGGAAGSMRFVEDTDGSLRPLNGYHGTLEPDFTDNSFDFYSKDGTRYHYRNFRTRAEWNLEYIEDTNGNLTKLAYDPFSRDHAKLIVVEDPAGRKLEFTWEDRYFNVSAEEHPVITAVSGPDGMSMTYEYDERGNLLRAARENDARVESYTYNVAADQPTSVVHKMLSYTNANGAVTNYTYNERETAVLPGTVYYLLMPFAHITTVEEPEGGVTRFDYGLPDADRAQTTRVTDARNYDTTYDMDGYGRVLTITDARSNITRMTWATDDVLMTSRTDANNVKTSFTYDSDGNMLSETVTTGLLSGYTITNTYAAIPDKPWIKNRLASRSDRNGHATTYEYDGNGNLSKVLDAENNLIQHSYADNGDRLSTRDARGYAGIYSYDVYGNLAGVTDPLGNTVTTAWNERSLPIKRTDARGSATTFDYDSLNRLIGKTDPFNNTRSYSYDAVGNKLSETDEEGRVTTWSYDLENRVKTVTNPLNDTLSYSYDAVGNKTRQTDWRGNSTTFDYDIINRLQTLTEPLGKITTYSYDGVGNVLSETDAENRTTSYEYDELNRRTKITDALNGVIGMEYDGENKLKETDQLGRAVSYAYDRINRLITQTEPLGRITSFVYDNNSNKIRETDPNGGIRTFDYDPLNRLSKAYDALNYVTTLFYDANGNVVTEVDARLNEVKHEYDALNRRSSTVDQAGFKTQFGYDKVGNPITQTLPNNNIVTHTYDGLNRLKTTGDNLSATLGPLATYDYDANGNRIRETDANGNVTTHVYDLLNRLTQSDLPETRTVKFGYDLVGNKLSETDARNKTTTFAYDALNRLTTVTDPLNDTLVSSYDAAGNKKTEQDKRHFVTAFDYDDLNRLVKVTDPLSQTLTYSYDNVGNKLSDTDKRGTVTQYAYDKENRLTRVTKDNLVINRLEYDEVGNKKFDTDANGNIIAYIYDKRNLLATESRELAAITNFSYDSMGDQVRERDPEGRINTWTYDLRRRLLSETNGANETTTHTYDGNGNRLSTQRPNSNTWTYAYDGADRLTSITDAQNGVTAFSYDKNSNRLSQRDARLNVTSYSYDDLNRQRTTTYADTKSESYTYDANGNRTGLTDARGQVFSYTYDELNRETQRSYPVPLAPSGDDIQSIATVYDANNNPTTITETYSGATGTRTTAKTYDKFDRLVSVTDAFNKAVKYSYDANGNRTTLTDADNHITRYSFDKLNRLVSVTAAGNISNYAYDRSSLQIAVNYPNGTVAENSYDNARRIEQIVNRQGAAIISQYDYTYDINGNRLTQIETNGGAAQTTTYGYDNNDRLTQVDYPDSTVTYSYDANYNRLSERSVNNATSAITVDKAYAYNNRNQLTGITDNADAAQNVTYQYDDNGNQVIKSKNGVTTTFIYDVRDQLLSVRENATTLGRYFYDYQGLRVAKTGDQGLVRYTYDDDSVLLQSDSSGATIAKYEYGPDRLLSLNHSSEGRQYYHFDALGSTVNLSKPDASIQARYQYDAWGNFRSQSGASFNDFTFTGHEKDTETNLFYFKARYYDPDTGRFLSQDPYLGEAQTPPSLHRYLYAYSNPSVYVDLTGYAACFSDNPAWCDEQRSEEQKENDRQAREAERQRKLNDKPTSEEFWKRVEEHERQGREETRRNREAEIIAENNKKPSPERSINCNGEPACDVNEWRRKSREDNLRKMGDTIKRLREEHIASDEEIEEASRRIESADLTGAAAIVGAVAAEKMCNKNPACRAGKEGYEKFSGDGKKKRKGKKTDNSNKEKNITDREKYLGRTPGKNSRTGKQVIKRMEKEGKIRTENGKKEVLGPDNRWYPIEKTDMGHKEDAVKWWNREGHKYGPKSRRVRKWMLDPNNYELEPSSINRAKGGSLKDRYRKPKKIGK